jgi:hypothetical protein
LDPILREFWAKNSSFNNGNYWKFVLLLFSTVDRSKVKKIIPLKEWRIVRTKYEYEFV